MIHFISYEIRYEHYACFVTDRCKACNTLRSPLSIISFLCVSNKASTARALQRTATYVSFPVWLPYP